MSADTGEQTLFWTDMTRQGCAGQYSACFTNASKYNGHVSSKIHATQFDGNCVAIYRNRDSTRLIYKTMQCKERLPMVCIGEVQVEDLLSTNILEVRDTDYEDWGILSSNESKECKPDVIYGLCSFSSRV
jgi:hypothetical protein